MNSDIEMLIAKERAEGLTDQERAILVNLLKGKEEQKKQLVNRHNNGKISCSKQGLLSSKITQNGNKNGTKSTIYRRAIFRTN